uniref:Uncharacterized protein n=1 Tax=Panagrolaimus superbus TaxID=310955 RepID=A0A914YCS8_9BILA
MHESVALQAVVADNGKPSDFAWEMALTDLVEWLHEQGDGLSLNVSSTKRVHLFFQIHNLSADLAGICHLFHFATWASSSEACMICKVQPIREHNAQRWGIIDTFIRRNNLNITLDMLRRTGGFKEGATFWMKLVNVLNYRFDNLHKICEGVCATLLKELYGPTKKMGNTLRIRELKHLETLIGNICWPHNTKIIFNRLNHGTATEKLGSFLISVPLALSSSDIKYEYIIWLLGMFLYLVFFVHLYEKTDLTEKVSTFIFESLNRYIKLHFDPNHQNGFTSAILDKFLLEKAVRYELVRRSEHCNEVKQYLDKINWRSATKSGVEVGSIILKGAEVAADEIKNDISELLDNHIKLGASDGNPVITTINIDNIIGHSLALNYESNIFYFNLALKSECK